MWLNTGQGLFFLCVVDQDKFKVDLNAKKKEANKLIFNHNYHLDKISLVNRGFIIANRTFSLYVRPEQEIPIGQYRAILPAHV